MAPKKTSQLQASPQKPPSSQLERMKLLPPDGFENLTYDLLFLSGLRNLRWRTPSADGGRDLEGEFSVIDFSGETNVERWYVECKRYQTALNWPTVYEKLAIAENHNADYLLFVTTSNFSAPCRDEVERHNKLRRVKIRIWPFYRLAHYLSVHGQVAAKYGLVDASNLAQFPFNSIIFEITKMTQSIQAALLFGGDVSSRVELLAAMMELLAARTSDVQDHGRFVFRRFSASRDSFNWCSPCPLLNAADFDVSSLRAVLSAIKEIGEERELTCSASSSKIEIAGLKTCAPFVAARCFLSY
jgi:Restriction endonuclease